MKPVSLIFFSIMIVSALIFATIYVYFQPLVESNPMAFSGGLVAIMVVGMFGMMNSIISETTIEKQRVY